MATDLLQQVYILLNGYRVFGKIGWVVKLGGVYKNAGHGIATGLQALAYQAQVPRMQGAHGRHKANSIIKRLMAFQALPKGG